MQKAYSVSWPSQWSGKKKKTDVWDGSAWVQNHSRPFAGLQVMSLVPDNKDTAAAGNFKELIGIFSCYKLWVIYYALFHKWTSYYCSIM